MSTVLSNEIPDAGNLLTLAPNQVVVDETKNLRRFAPEAKGIEELAEDILKNGQLQPVIVSKNGADGQYVLVAGFRRMRALTLLNEQGNEIPVLATLKDMEGRNPSVINLAENLKRKELTLMDLAVAVKALQESGMANKDVAKELKKSPSFVSQVSKFTELRPDIQKKIHNGDIGLNVARELVSMDEAEQDKFLDAAEKAKAAGEDQLKAGSGVAKKNKKSTRGRKSKGEEKHAGGISAKKAVHGLETMIAAAKDGESKVTKAIQAALDVQALVVKFLNGKLGVKALHNKLVDLF